MLILLPHSMAPGNKFHRELRVQSPSAIYTVAMFDRLHSPKHRHQGATELCFTHFSSKGRLSPQIRYTTHALTADTKGYLGWACMVYDLCSVSDFKSHEMHRPNKGASTASHNRWSSLTALKTNVLGALKL